MEDWLKEVKGKAKEEAQDFVDSKENRREASR